MGETCPPSANEAWIAEQGRWARGWRRAVLPSVFLVYLAQVGGAVVADSRGIGVAAGFVILAAFVAGYVLVLLDTGQSGGARVPVLTATLGALCLAELPFAHADALVMGVFVAAVAVVTYGERAVPVVVALTGLAVVLPGVVPSWHGSFTSGFGNGTAIAIPMVSLVMFIFGRVVKGNRQLSAARVEIARLAAENERTRIARDLHDLLGHSLTTIALKAELAERLSHVDVEGAVCEIAEVEALTRRALADVRAAVGNYREVSLANELATGREVLRAAGIAAEIPPASDVVDDATQELFGWVVREGLTNIVRHSRASSCRVRIAPWSVEIVDDGVGGGGRGRGNGLLGLSERVVAAGGVLEAGPLSPAGWRLAVHLQAAAP